MKPNLDTVLHLLHAASSGTLATNSLALPGYPFATALPFVPDQRHCPVFLVSRLAEHTKNLLADGRASFLISSPHEGSVLAGARMTLVGDVAHIDASPELTARYLRYQPAAEQYLSLGDFAFFQLMPKRARHIAGFGQMGWVEQSELANAAVLPSADEAQYLQQLAGIAPSGVRLLGIDHYGCDLEQDGKRVRLHLPGPASQGDSATKLLAGIERLLRAS